MGDQCSPNQGAPLGSFARSAGPGHMTSVSAAPGVTVTIDKSALLNTLPLDRSDPGRALHYDRSLRHRAAPHDNTRLFSPTHTNPTTLKQRTSRLGAVLRSPTCHPSSTQCHPDYSPHFPLISLDFPRPLQFHPSQLCAARFDTTSPFTSPRSPTGPPWSTPLRTTRPLVSISAHAHHDLSRHYAPTQLLPPLKDVHI